MSVEPESTSAPAPASRLRFKTIDRQQMTWAAIDVDQLVAPDHLVRAIWELVGPLDWSKFYAEVKAVEAEAGCSAYDPRLLASLWILAYSEGVSSARQVERLCAYAPAYRWLTGMRVINHHTLSDFRVDYKEELDELFTQVLAVLQAEGMIQLERVMQDGTKVKAAASPSSFHREETLQKHLEEARQAVQRMADPRQQGGAEASARQRKAQERAARDKQERLSQSLEELKKIQREAKKPPEQCRASETEPEARTMKHRDGSFAPSYNLQVVSDATTDVIVDVQVVQAANDQGQLENGLKEVDRRTGVVPAQAVVDEGFLSWKTVLEMAEQKVGLIAGGTALEARQETLHQQNRERRGVDRKYYPQEFVYDAERDLYRCPEGAELHYRGKRQEGAGAFRYQYRADASTCRGCPHQPQCCPGKSEKPTAGRTMTRTEYVPKVAAFIEKMKTPEAQAIYKERKRVAEFPNLWLKEKLKLRRFRVRGLAKVACEAILACLTYNIQQWARLKWKPRLAAGVATT